MIKKYLKNKKRGSATIVIIISSFILMLYARSTYFEVVNMKKLYNIQEKNIMEMYEQKMEEKIKSF